jgi:D-glycero-D-manno-heptose 1,7-bisphosphate phosphatase
MKKLKVDATWTLFLDRDGVINKRNFDGYITQPEDFEFEETVLTTLPQLANQFGYILIVTNQQGVAKKIMSESNLEAVHRYMLKAIKKAGGRIDQVFCAINLKGTSNDRRKPNSSMAFEAKAKYPMIDFKKSIMVGDTDSDIVFGKKNGMKTVLIRSAEAIMETADYEIDTFRELLEIIE